MPSWLSYLVAAVARVAAALYDRWQAVQQAMARGAAEEQARSQRAAEDAEALGRKAAEEAAKQPIEENDGFRRD